MPSKKKVALFIDADNVPPDSVHLIMRKLESEYGEVTYRRAYSTQPNNGERWGEVLANYSMQSICQASSIRGKNCSDIKMTVDAMDVLYEGAADCFCIVSSDSDFTALAARLKEKGKTVVGFGESSKVKADGSFAQACTDYVFIDKLTQTPKATSANKDAKLPTASAAKQTRPKLEKIKGTIRAVVQKNSKNGRGMLLSQLGSEMRKQHPGFEAKAYGFSTLSKLVASVEGAELVPPDNPKKVIIRSKNDRKTQVKDLVAKYVREAGKRGRTISDINGAIQSAFPGQRLDDLGYSSMKKLIEDVPGVKLKAVKGGTERVVSSS